jgi:hypothetical protein
MYLQQYRIQVSRFWIAFSIFLLMLNVASAQQNDCSCINNLNFLITKVQNNYIGFTDKVSGINQKTYNFFTDSLKREAVKAETKNCIPVLRKYTDFFNDPHLIAYFNPKPANSNQIRAFLANSETINWTEDQLQRYLDSAEKKDWIEGIWETEDRSSKIAIIRYPANSRDFVGFVLKDDSIFWMPRQVKIKIKKVAENYQGIFFSRDHIPSQIQINKNNDGSYLAFEVKGRSLGWLKVYPSINLTRKGTSSFNPSKIFEPNLRLDRETAILTIPSFKNLYKSTIDSIIAANWHTLLTNKNPHY